MTSLLELFMNKRCNPSRENLDVVLGDQTRLLLLVRRKRQRWASYQYDKPYVSGSTRRIKNTWYSWTATSNTSPFVDVVSITWVNVWFDLISDHEVHCSVGSCAVRYRRYDDEAWQRSAVIYVVSNNARAANIPRELSVLTATVGGSGLLFDPRRHRRDGCPVCQLWIQDRQLDLDPWAGEWVWRLPCDIFN